jgi:hypothetical protein
MGNLANVLQQLRAERREAELHLEKLDNAIAVVESLGGSGASRTSNQPTGVTSAPTRIISAASRRKMALAQQARWARARKEGQPVVGAAKTSGSALVKRTMSASARRKIAAAQRARWARARQQSHSVSARPSKTGAAPVTRTMSAAARRKLSALQSARWAKLRAARKKAA